MLHEVRILLRQNRLLTEDEFRRTCYLSRKYALWNKMFFPAQYLGSHYLHDFAFHVHQQLAMFRDIPPAVVSKIVNISVSRLFIATVDN